MTWELDFQCSGGFETTWALAATQSDSKRAGAKNQPPAARVAASLEPSICLVSLTYFAGLNRTDLRLMGCQPSLTGRTLKVN